MQAYELSFKKYNLATVDFLHSAGLTPRIGRWGTRLCATVCLSDSDRQELLAELAVRGYLAECSEIFENQPK